MWYLFIISTFYITVPAILGSLLFNKLKIEFKLLSIYLIIFSLLEVTGYVLSVGLKMKNNLFLIHIFAPIELILFAFIFYFHFQNWPPRKFIIIGLIILIIFSIINSKFIQPIRIYPTNFIYLESTTLILLSLTYFYQVFTELKVEKLWLEGMFWLSTGLLFYHSGTMILYLSSNYLMQTVTMDLFKFFHTLVLSVCHLLTYSLFTLAIWVGRKQSI
jgi:hypothetical protein